VKRHIYNDLKSKTRPTTDFLRSLNTNEARHELTRLVLEKVDALGMRKPGIIDPFGGRIPDHGVFLKEHGGLFNLSLDRIDNTKDHPVPGPDPLANLRFGILGMNVKCSLDKAPEYGFTGGADTCDLLRKLFHAEVPAAAIEQAIQGESYISKQDQGKQVWSCLGQGALHIYNKKKKDGTWKDPKCRAAFPNARAFYEHVLDLYKKQRGQCALQRVLFADRTACKDHPFKASIDAIDPRLGHVPGNLRIVCAFLNGVNRDVQKKHADPRDPPTSWTEDLWQFYIDSKIL
jgi:hypothetical protein